MTQFHIILQTPPAHLGGDHMLHTTQAFDYAKVYIAAKHKRPQGRHQLTGGFRVARHRAGLDQGIALPVPPLILVILFQGGEIVHQGAALAIGSQAHIHPKHKALRSHLVQGIDYRLPHLGEKLLVTDRLGIAVSLARFRESENKIDIGGYIELARTQLAHSQHDQLLSLSAMPPHGRTKTLFQGCLREQQCLGNRRLRQQ